MFPDENNLKTYEDKVEKKWFGIPPKGTKPLPGKTRYVLEITLVILVEFVLWGIYRVITAPLYGSGFNIPFFIGHIIAAPTIHLLPIIVYWKFFRKEKGHPFVFTRKKLMSGLAIGLLSAILWRVLEMIVGDTLSAMAGGVQFGTLGIYSLLDSTTLGLFLLMSFTHFCIVGPVEELQFRSFVHDQSSRVLTNWQALVFSSIFFGAAHIPIAITVYKMPFWHLVVAEIGWMSAGFTFGALYMWSRNIYACIIMHGMGNWQLSVFWLTSRIVPGGMSEMSALVMGTLTSLIVNALMVIYFYMIYKYYWEPQRRGDPIFKGKLAKLKRYVYEHDYGLKGKTVGNTLFQSMAFSVVVCFLVLGATFAVGETNLSKMVVFPDFPGGGGTGNLDDMVLTPEGELHSGYLAEGEIKTITIASSFERYIRSVSVTLTWEDEPDTRQVRYYENTGDIFSVTVTGNNETDSHWGENQHGQQCTVLAGIEYTDEQILNLSEANPAYSVDVNILMETAGNYEARAGLGMLQLVDGGNDYSCQVDIEWLTSEIANPEEETVMETILIF